MEVTINLPERVFASLTKIAKKSRRRLDEVIVERIEQEFEAEVETLDKQISRCSDKEVLGLAKLRMPTRQARRLSALLQKQGEQALSAREQDDLWRLIDDSRLATVKKAFALREIARRGLHAKD